MLRTRSIFLVLITVVVLISGYGFTAVPANNTAGEVQCTYCPNPPRPPVDVHYSHSSHYSHPQSSTPVHHYQDDCQYGAHPQHHHDSPIYWYGTGNYHPSNYTYHDHDNKYSSTVYYVKYPTSSVRYINRRHPLVTGNY